jgi:AcrR family transcriptional regulator
VQETRTEPRQRRSQQSIDAILDAAEQLIHQRGQVDFTAKELSEAAGMSIGRIYYWFPDIPAVVDALVLRCVNNLLLIDSENAGDGTVFAIRNSIDTVARFADENPAAVALCLTAGTSGAGSLLFNGLRTSISARIVRRVPDITPAEVEVVSNACVGMILGMLNTYVADNAARDLLKQEISYVVSAYLHNRFPPADSPLWTIDNPVIHPARPSSAGSFETATAWPALAPDRPAE